MFGRDSKSYIVVAVAGIALAAVAAPPLLDAQTPIRAGTSVSASAPGNDWPAPGRDLGAGRFSPLKQITPDNVATLQTAWSFDPGQPGLQVVPIVVNNVMYITAGRQVIALDATTGVVKWKFSAPAALTRRGVSYWPGDATHPARVYTGSGDKMLALDAVTGEPLRGFGDAGFVDMKTSIKGDVDGQYSMASPPTVYKNILITGGNNGEGSPSLGLHGDIRAWDAITGKMLWTFHTVPHEGEPGVETWAGNSWKDRSGTNTWSYFTVDEERGVVYAPTGAPTSDYYGADRKGNNLYGNTLLALDASTGKLKWFRQIVHHDLWDFDLPAAPALITVRRNNQNVPAVAVMTKMSLLFIFNRDTGEPIFGIEERPVPQSNVPGEATSPTQPFPIKPEPLGRTTFDPARDFNTTTPEATKYCKDLWDKNAMYTKGMYTPPGTDGTMLTFPSTIGGGNWNGLSYDPTLHLVFTNVSNIGQVAKMAQGTD